MARFTLVTRVGPRVAKTGFGTLDAALDGLRAALDGADTAVAPERSVLGRSYAPGVQVSGRFEIRGPGVRGGVDVHGDGSLVAYTGRIRKTLVAPASGESVLDALERALRS